MGFFPGSEWFRMQEEEKLRRLREGIKPSFTLKQLDNANQQDFMDMMLELRTLYRDHKYVRGPNGKPKLFFKPVEPVHPDCWKKYHQDRKLLNDICRLLNKPTSNDDDDQSEVEADVPARRFEPKGSPYYRVVLGTDGKWREFYNPLDVPTAVSENAGNGGNSVFEGSPSNPIDESASREKAAMEKAEEKIPVDFGTEGMSGLVEGSSYNPLDVPENAGHGWNLVFEGSPSNPIDESASCEKAAIEKAQEMTPLDFGTEGMSGLMEEGSFNNPLSVPENAGHGWNSVFEGPPSNSVVDCMSLDKAGMEKAEEKMPMQKKRKSLPLSPGRISMKKINLAERETTRD